MAEGGFAGTECLDIESIWDEEVLDECTLEEKLGDVSEGAMEGETSIERSIKKLVYREIQEQVFLDVSKSNAITVKHRSKHGSTAFKLAKFWLRVLKDRNNYPEHKFPYRKQIYKPGFERVILKVDSVTLTTYMSTGTLMIQGNSVLEWFKNTFPRILSAYDAPIKDQQPLSKLTESREQLMDNDTLKKASEEKEVQEREDNAIKVADDLDTVLDTVNTEQAKFDIENTPVTETGKEGGTIADPLTTKFKLMSLDVWSDTLTKQLCNLRTVSVRDGRTYIYTLWKSVLHHWFSDPDRKVYIVTPFLDSSRLVDVCNIILEHRLEANLDAFYVRQKCDHKRNIFEVKKDALEKYDVKDQDFIKNKIFNNIIIPLKTFHAKFIACLKGSEAEVLITSANFHADQFEYSNMDSVQFQTMSDVDFISRCLAPVKASVRDH